MDKSGIGQTRTYVAGYRGMVGGAIVRQLLARGVAADRILKRTHAEQDLTDQVGVKAFFAQNPGIDQVAAKVGGIHANNIYPADFIDQNLKLQANVVEQAFVAGVKRLLFLGFSCIYPRMAPQPMAEGAVLTGTREPTNEPCAIAEIAGIKLCESCNRQYGARRGIDYRSLIPTNLYGPGDNYRPQNSHVLPAPIRRLPEAREAAAPQLVIWGVGTPKREFLYGDDMAAARIHVMKLAPKVYRRSRWTRWWPPTCRWHNATRCSRRTATPCP